MHLECVKEFCKDLVLGFLTFFDVRVHLSVVGALYVLLAEDARAISVDLFEGFLNKSFSDLVHLTSDGAHQLIVVDLTTIICVEVIKQLPALFWRHRHTEVTQRLPKLLDVQSSTAIVVHDFENPLHAEQSTGAPSCQLLSEERSELIVVFLDAAVVNSSGSLAIRQPRHIGVSTVGDVFATSCALHVRAITLVSIRGTSIGLPLTVLAFLKDGLLVCAKQVAMVITSVSVSGVYGRYFVLRSSVWHGCGVVRRLNIPSVGHHQLEVGVVVNAPRDVRVVLQPLLGSDHSVRLAASDCIVVLFKGLKELGEDLIRCALARLDIWVHLGVIGATDVINSDLSIACAVK